MWFSLSIIFLYLRCFSLQLPAVIYVRFNYFLVQCRLPLPRVRASSFFFICIMMHSGFWQILFYSLQQYPPLHSILFTHRYLSVLIFFSMSPIRHPCRPCLPGSLQVNAFITFLLQLILSCTLSRRRPPLINVAITLSSSPSRIAFDIAKKDFNLIRRLEEVLKSLGLSLLPNSAAYFHQRLFRRTNPRTRLLSRLGFVMDICTVALLDR